MDFDFIPGGYHRGTKVDLSSDLGGSEGGLKQISGRTQLDLQSVSGALPWGPWRPKADISEAEGQHFGVVWGGEAPHEVPRGLGAAALPKGKCIFCLNNFVQACSIVFHP